MVRFKTDNTRHYRSPTMQAVFNWSTNSASERQMTQTVEFSAKQNGFPTQSHTGNSLAFPHHVRNYSAIHVRCDNYFMSFSVSSSMYRLFSVAIQFRAWAFPTLYVFPFLNFHSLQQSNFWVETLLHHNSCTTRRIHTIFPRQPARFPDFPRFSLTKLIP